MLNKLKIYRKNIILAILLFMGFILFVNIFRKNNRNIETETMLPGLNEISLIDIKGNKINILGSEKFTYLQFMPSFDEGAIQFFNDVVEKWRSQDIKFIVITRDIFHSFDNIIERSAIILNDYDKIAKALRASIWGDYYLFNNMGKLLFRGNTSKKYQEELKTMLNHEILNKYFNLSSLVLPGKKIHELSWFKNISNKEIKSKYKVYAFFTTVCSGCMSGDVINIIKNKINCEKNVASVFIILNRAVYKKEDIKILKSQLELDFDIIIADDSLNSKWDELINEYSESELTNIVLVADIGGNIVRAFYRNCDKCWNLFGDFMRKLCTK